MAVLLETTLGDIVIDLFTEERPKSKNALLSSLNWFVVSMLVAGWVSYLKGGWRNYWLLAQTVSTLLNYSDVSPKDTKYE